MDNSKGVIYILTNPSFPDYVKIGYTRDLEKRIKQLNSSVAIPFAFRKYATYEVETKLADKYLHHLLDQLDPDLRAREIIDGKERKREFYKMNPEKAYSILKDTAKISGTTDRLKKVTPEGHEIMENETTVEIDKGITTSELDLTQHLVYPTYKLRNITSDELDEPITERFWTDLIKSCVSDIPTFSTPISNGCYSAFQITCYDNINPKDTMEIYIASDKARDTEFICISIGSGVVKPSKITSNVGSKEVYRKKGYSECRVYFSISKGEDRLKDVKSVIDFLKEIMHIGDDMKKQRMMN
ncbi:GIY-YIG nuclease family protein [Butyrivibrio sp. AC2005]|uniref:GIY-YIG nuclease family protein n=1 Tax=Butyrivibrio sp. AC2005 TaxID=1280672 RepID=UPI00040F6491|nr:GIY-YIG nuclease family protein [Butyrivibrio sp. AC2005]